RTTVTPPTFPGGATEWPPAAVPAISLRPPIRHSPQRPTRPPTIPTAPPRGPSPKRNMLPAPAAGRVAHRSIPGTGPECPDRSARWPSRRCPAGGSSIEPHLVTEIGERFRPDAGYLTQLFHSLEPVVLLPPVVDAVPGNLTDPLHLLPRRQIRGVEVDRVRRIPGLPPGFGRLARGGRG